MLSFAGEQAMDTTSDTAELASELEQAENFPLGKGRWYRPIWLVKLPYDPAHQVTQESRVLICSSTNSPIVDGGQCFICLDAINLQAAISITALGFLSTVGASRTSVNG